MSFIIEAVRVKVLVAVIISSVILVESEMKNVQLFNF